MKLGIALPLIDTGGDPATVRDFAQAAEALGYDHLAAPDHVLGVNVASRPDWGQRNTSKDLFHDPFVMFGFLSACTAKIEFSTQVMILPQRQTALVAKQAAQVDILCGGRLRLGVGVGWNPVEYEALGQEWKTRGRREAEQIELMNRLWTERAVSFEGKFHRVRHSGLNPLPIQRPIPIWLGGASDATLKRAAKYAQGWIPLSNPDEETRGRLATLHGYLGEEGRDPGAFGIECWIRVKNGGPDEWRAAVDQWRALGVTHVTFYTSGQGIGPLDKQIEAMRRFSEAMR
ncbi:MAG TPA: LLM class F420-dependent oxidoreductase [Burkholderiales bacterium]|nr:LLM class F420-dependent oxidoreductase [Burkholderiales bacterium]